MLELIQFPWSPYCLLHRRILEFAGVPHKITNIPPSDRSLVWRITKQRYYQVPVLRDGRQVLFETGDDTQVIAKYLDAKLGLGLFPREWDGVQRIIWRCIESEVEALTFRLNDACFEEFVPAREQLPYIRHKERKFGRGCIEQWRAGQKQLLADLSAALVPFEQMLASRPFLLDSRPRFVDFDLWGMLANFLYSGNYRLPSNHPKIKAWHGRMSKLAHSEK